MSASTNADPEDFMQPAAKIASLSLVVAVIVLALKTLSWWITGSIALLSDALESIVNIATALAALLAIHVASRPADDNHPFGHHKAEYFSAVLEGVMIVIAALFILKEAYDGFLVPQQIDAPIQGLAINTIATCINAIWAWVLVRSGRKLRSPALVADGKHLWTDVFTSGGIAVGVVIAWITGLWVLDSLLAVVVAINILISGFRVILGSMSGLMDEAVPKAELSLIEKVISEQSEGAIEVHDIKSRQAGSVTFVEFHLVVSGQMSVFDSHEICDRIEHGLEQAISNIYVTIHVEPDHKSKHRADSPMA